MLKKRILASVLVLIVALFAGGCAAQEEQPAEGRISDTQVVPVEVMVARQGNMTIERQKGARLTAAREALVIPAMPGKVTEVLVSVGEHVEKDQVLFRLDDTSVQQQIDQAQAAYNTAQAGIDLSQQTRADLESQKAEAQQDLDEFYEDVHPRDVKNKLKQVNKAISDLNTALKSGVLTDRDIYDVTYSELTASRDQLTGLLSQEAMLKQAVEGYDNAINNLPFSQDTMDAQLNQAREGVSMAKEALDNFTVKAPAAGTVASVLVSAGDFATQSMPPVTIVDTESLILQVPLTEYEVTRVSAGDHMTVSVDALDKTYDGVVEWVSPSMEARTQSYYAKLRIENADGDIRPGMYAEAEVIVDQAEGLLLPKEALVKEGDVTYVYLIEEGTAHRVAVTLGLDDGYTVQVLSGVKAGDTVAIKGQAYLNDGIAIEITEEAVS